jgi:hypothetical protein
MKRGGGGSIIPGNLARLEIIYPSKNLLAAVGSDHPTSDDSLGCQEQSYPHRLATDIGINLRVGRALKIN